MWRPECAWAEPRLPPSTVDGWQLTVTKASWHLGASGGGPAVGAAGQAALLTLEREREGGGGGGVLADV